MAEGAAPNPVNKKLWQEMTEIKLLNADKNLKHGKFFFGDCLSYVTKDSSVPHNVITGKIWPKSELYKDYAIRIEIHLPSVYPTLPPEVKIDPAIYHPNVDEDGRLCPDGLLENRTYQAGKTLMQLLEVIIDAVDNPQTNKPMNGEAANDYDNNRVAYEQKAAEKLKKAEKRQSEAVLTPWPSIPFQDENRPVMYLINFDKSSLELHPDTRQLITYNMDYRIVNDLSAQNPQIPFCVLSSEPATSSLISNANLIRYYHVSTSEGHVTEDLITANPVITIISIKRFPTKFYTDVGQYYRDKACQVLAEQKNRDDAKDLLGKSIKSFELLKYTIGTLHQHIFDARPHCN